MRTRLVGLLLVGLSVACGDEDATQAPPAVLKDGAHLLPSPESGFVVFPLTLSGSQSSLTVTLNAVGKEAVTLSAICIETPEQAFADAYVPCAAPVENSAFSLTLPDLQVSSGALAGIGVTFAPTERGVKVMRLVVTNTSDNLPTLSFELVGPGATFPLLTTPDIAAFETSVRFVNDGAGGSVGFARYYNLGGGQLVVSNYAVDGEGFAFQTGVLTPSAGCADAVCGEDLPNTCEAVNVGTGSSRVLGLRGTAAAGAGTLSIQSNDPDTCNLVMSLAALE